MPVKTIIQWRRDSSADWVAANPVLADGEAGYDTTVKQFKIGDGTSTWTELPYFSGDASLDAFLLAGM